MSNGGPGIAQRTWAIWRLAGGWTAQFAYSAAISHGYVYDTVVIFVIFWFSGSVGFFSGAITGFLFGIPKTIVLRFEQDKEQSHSKYRANSNIEEISDWLTKIKVLPW